MDALETAKQSTAPLAMTIKEPSPANDPRFCAGHEPHEERIAKLESVLNSPGHAERFGKLERFVQFIAEKTGVHFNVDEFHAIEAKRPPDVTITG